MTIPFTVAALTDAQLKHATTPSGGGLPEALAWTLYDTATYVSGATTNLRFYTAARANQQATNLNTPGQLPSPQWFQIMWFGAKMIVPNATTAWRDTQRLIEGGTAGPPTWNFNLSQKDYGPFPLMELQPHGGITGFGTQTSDAYANNGVIGCVGGWQDGAIIIPPQEGFNLALEWDGAQTLAGNVLIQVIMKGVLSRRVL